ncbi:hypothetical protein ACNI65_02220 [Roseateles sp. So40a]|uniref:hypothetical protein n=1 Tax=Roseateles sp. So40a TaxID=3400226 RepID=UPI003A89CF9D
MTDAAPAARETPTTGPGPGLDRACTAAAAAVWTSAWIEVLVRDRYHALYSQLDNMAWLIALGGFYLLERLVARWAPKAWAATLSARYLVLAAVLWAWIVLFGGASGQRFVAGVILSAALAVGLLIAMPWLLRRMPAASASALATRGPMAIAVAAMLFVLLPPAMALWSAPSLSWPSRQAATAPAASQTSPAFGRDRTVLILLFDELNDAAVGGIQAALTAQGLHVAHRPLEPVGDGTAKVVPAMWLGRPFKDPKPCSNSAICSGRDILDFSKVLASRQDIDVVGFYHPYCAMQGLRWCRRESPLGVFDWSDRWVCAVRRRMGLTMPERCHREQHLSWTRLVERTEQAYWQAPFWQQGGMLYAHLPFPHPPASDSRQTFVEQYAAGTSKAARLASASVERLRAAGIKDIAVIVTSDHPLRVDGWCSNGTYSARRCQGSEQLKDSKVPLLVAADGALPELAPFNSNQQVFDVLDAPVSAVTTP